VIHEEYSLLLQQYIIPPKIQKIAESMLKGILRDRSISTVDELAELRKQRTVAKKQRESVMMRYGMGEIPKEVYDLTKTKLDRDLDHLNVEISKLEKNSSNQVSDVNRLILTSCKLSDLWENGTYEIRQNLQKLAFPNGVIWDKEIQKPRTITENGVLTILRSLSSIYKNEEKEKTGKTCDFSGLVAEAGLEPATSGL